MNHILYCILCLVLLNLPVSAHHLPNVGVSVLLFDKDDNLLLGLRQGSHGAGTWAPPGGHMELCEDPKQTAVREIMEEIGVKIKPEDLSYIGITNDIFKEEKKHYITIFLAAHIDDKQTVSNLEPDKCKEWSWFDADASDLSEELFLPLRNLFSNKDIKFEGGKYPQLEGFVVQYNKVLGG